MASRSPVTCHVLDQAAGRPAAGVTVTLEKLSSAVPLAAAGRGGPADWEVLAVGRTDADGRCTTLLDPAVPPDAGVYRATFDVQEYFEARGTQTFYPFVQVHFNLADPLEHYHIPLLLAPFGFSTYRGS